ncbi:MAG: hypothetical protein AAF438_06535 [Pseudomonadota bacterium]
MTRSQENNMIMTALFFLVCLLALATLVFWKRQVFGQRLLAAVGIFATPVGIGLFLDNSPGAIYVLGTGLVALIAVAYFDARFRTH